MNRLVPCPACSRHVLSIERRCPFCGAELPATVSPPATLPRTRLGRAAMFAAGATLVGVAACAGPPVPLYGAPAPVDAGSGGTGGGGGAGGGTAGDTGSGG